MKTIRDLIEEAKRRTVVVAVCVFAFAYLMTLSSSSVWFNIPFAFFMVAGLRHLSLELDVRWRRTECDEQDPDIRGTAARHRQTRARDYIHATKESTRNKWRRAVDSPVVEAAIDELTQSVVNEWIVQLWFSALSPDIEVPEEIKLLINGVIGEVAQRAKKVNLITLLTRDVVDLVGSHLELFRRTQARVGVDVLAKLSLEQRDEKLKESLIASRELHPALLSADAEYEVLRRLMEEVACIVLKPQDKQNKLIRSLARELLGCAVMRPVMNLANPGLINQIIEGRVQAARNKVHIEQPLRTTALTAKVNKLPRTLSEDLSLEMSELSTADLLDASQDYRRSGSISALQAPSGQECRSDATCPKQPVASKAWAQPADLPSNRKSQVLAPEHLDNMWTKGRNYKKREGKTASLKAAQLVPFAGPSKTQLLERCMEAQAEVVHGEEGSKARLLPKDVAHSVQKSSDKINIQKSSGHASKRVKESVSRMMLEDNDEEDVPGIGFAGSKLLKAPGSSGSVGSQTSLQPLRVSEAKRHPLSFLDVIVTSAEKDRGTRLSGASESLLQHKRTRSGGPGLDGWQDMKRGLDNQQASWRSAQGPDVGVVNPGNQVISRPLQEKTSEGTTVQSPSNFCCKVIGYHALKDVSRPFVLYTISVRDSENRIWKVQRRYSNFEQLHRRLKEIPFYDLMLPPKRFLSFNMDDSFILERCKLLDGYLQELLARPNISEQHEVWDFLSINSLNYAANNSSSIIKTFTGNVDNAVDDVFRQIRWVSDDIQEVFKTATTGIKKRITSGSIPTVRSSSSLGGDLPQTLLLTDAANGERGLAGHLLDEDLGNMDNSPPQTQYDGAFSDSELPARHDQTARYRQYREGKAERALSEGHSPVESLGGSDTVDEDLGIPQEWAPPKLSVPLLNLVDIVFQLQNRGWIRRQVFWIAKEALQLVMGDAMDDWLLGKIQWLQKEDVIASGIRWVKGFLWRDGIFITKRNGPNSTPRANNGPGSMGQPPPTPTFEQQREAARRKDVVREVMLERAPIALVSLIGRRQYQRCAKDLYYFLQSALFVKQLAYSLLEVLILAAFPELHDVVLDVRSSVM